MFPTVHGVVSQGGKGSQQPDGTQVSRVSVSTAVQTSPSATSIEVPTPDGVQDGDVLIASAWSFSTAGVAAPSGWAEFERVAPHMRSYYRVVTDAVNEPASHVFTLTGSRAAVAVAAYRHVGLFQSGRGATENGQALVLPGLQAVAPGALLALGVTHAGSDNSELEWAPDGEMSLAAAASSASLFGSAVITQGSLSAVGATGDRNLVNNAAGAPNSYGHLLLLGDDLDGVPCSFAKGNVPPPGLRPGDLIVTVRQKYGGANLSTTPGWTLIAGANNYADGHFRTWVEYRVATADDVNQPIPNTNVAYTGWVRGALASVATSTGAVAQAPMYTLAEPGTVVLVCATRSTGALGFDPPAAEFGTGAVGGSAGGSAVGGLVNVAAGEHGPFDTGYSGSSSLGGVAMAIGFVAG